MTSSWVDSEVGSVRLRWGMVRYREFGEGPVVLFVHGVLVNGELWREVVEGMGGRFRCIVPDLPLGGHTVPLTAGVDTGPGAVAEMVGDLMEALDLTDVTLVGNDTGGAICQVVVSRRPERVGRLVLTSCDAYEAFFPLPVRPLQYASRVFGERFTDLLAGLLRFRVLQRALVATVARRKLDDATLDAYFGPLRDPAVRRDLTGFLRQVSNRYTLDAARDFDTFAGPVLIIWGKDDLLFSARLARRLRDAFRDARLEFVAGSRAFVPLDRPQRLVEEIEAFVPRNALRG